MTQPIHLIADIYCMPIPEDASAIETHVAGGIQKIVFSSKIQDPAQCGGDMIALPPGNWDIICTTKEVYFEEEKAKDKSVDRRVSFEFTYADLRSLLTSKGLDPDKNYVIIKKVS